MKEFLICDQCDKVFKRTLKRDERNQNLYDEVQVLRRHFCSPECSYAYSREHDLPGRFEVGHKPWNDGLAGKGVCKPNSGNFKKRHKPNTWLPVGTIVIRNEHRKRKYPKKRRWLKISEPNKWIEYSRWIWIQKYGKIPKGMIIYHIDGDSLHDYPENLKLITRRELLFLNDKKKRGVANANIHLSLQEVRSSF